LNLRTAHGVHSADGYAGSPEVCRDRVAVQPVPGREDICAGAAVVLADETSDEIGRRPDLRLASSTYNARISTVRDLFSVGRSKSDG
jgi:hypothetical protein